MDNNNYDLDKIRFIYPILNMEISFDEMEKAALSAKPFKAFIDPEDPMFEAAGNMPQRVWKYCKKQVSPYLKTTVKFSAVFMTVLL